MDCNELRHVVLFWFFEPLEFYWIQDMRRYAQTTEQRISDVYARVF